MGRNSVITKIERDEEMVRMNNNSEVVYLQWKSDVWRNISIRLVEAIKSENPEEIKEALHKFEETRSLFPYTQIGE